MRKWLVCAAVVAGLCRPAPAAAWGFAAHQLIMREAIKLLPAELRPVFEQRRAEIVLRVTDPDLWRNVGWAEDPNHFLDFGVKEYGAYPFKRLAARVTARRWRSSARPCSIATAGYPGVLDE